MSLLALFSIWYIYTKSPNTLDYKLGLIAGCFLTLCAHYLVKTWEPSLLDWFFGVN
jgi:hypothetical protein